MLDLIKYLQVSLSFVLPLFCVSFPVISIHAHKNPSRSSSVCFRVVLEHTQGFQDMTDMLAHLWENKSHINSSVSLPSPRLQIVFLQLYFDTDTSVCIQIDELSPHGKTITKSFIQMERQTALHDLVISRRVRHLYQRNLKIISVICVRQLCKNVKMVNVGSDLSLSVKKKKV